MHQSPEKQAPRRRDRYGDQDVADAVAERRMPRGAQPKARKNSQRDDSEREQRWDKRQS